jgi:iron complex transport system substrate-binding protein
MGVLGDMHQARKYGLIALCLTVGGALAYLAQDKGRESSPYPREGGETRVITDAAGRKVTIPKQVTRVICSGSGCLRLLTYLGASDLAVGVDSIEKRGSQVDLRPYAITHPAYGNRPLIGEFRGQDNPELIAALAPRPQVIFKTYPRPGHDPARLEAQTGIPVILLDYGDLTDRRKGLNLALRIMGTVLDRSERAEEVIAFFDGQIADLDRRTRDMAPEDRPRCYVGGIAMRGAMGFENTAPDYAPFVFTNTANVAAKSGSSKHGRNTMTVSREQIMAWNPDTMFMDLAMLRLNAAKPGEAGIPLNRAYSELRAIREGRVFGLLPQNSYGENFGSVLANAYFIGKILYPERFEDIDPKDKADDIYRELLGRHAFSDMNRRMGVPAFETISIRK